MIQYKTFESWDLMRYLRDELKINIEDLSEDIDYLTMNSLSEQNGQKNFYFTAFDGNKIVGVLKLKTEGSDSLRNPGYYNWLSFCSVSKEYRGLGISENLIKNMFDFMTKKGIKDLLASGYTESGLKYLEPKLEKYSKKNNINFKDEKEVSF